MEPKSPSRKNAAVGGGRSRRASPVLPLRPAGRGPAPGASGHEGGQYKPLTDAEVARIHSAVLDALEVVGLSQAPESGVEIMTGAGAILGDDGRLRFPRALVEDMLARRRSRDSRCTVATRAIDLDLSGDRVHYGTAGAAVHVVDGRERLPPLHRAGSL
jgi:trimethylamine--corrinoid protein Co-methyltransferase